MLSQPDRERRCVAFVCESGKRDAQAGRSTPGLQFEGQPRTNDLKQLRIIRFPSATRMIRNVQALVGRFELDASIVAIRGW
jgi:hypothetical protein